MVKKTKKITQPKVKSTYDEFIESLTPQKKKAFDKELKEFLLSELLLAIIEKDDISIKKLAKEVGISPTVIHAMQSDTAKKSGLKSFFKGLQGLGFNKVTFGGRGRNKITLDISHLYTK